MGGLGWFGEVVDVCFGCEGGESVLFAVAYFCSVAGEAVDGGFFSISEFLMIGPGRHDGNIGEVGEGPGSSPGSSHVAGVISGICWFHWFPPWKLG